MIQIRQGVFETNSSSTHAISICEYCSNVELPDVVKFESNQDFGWEFEKYNDVYSKANYLWLAICYMYDTPKDEDKLLNAKAILTQYLENIGVRAEFDEIDYKESPWNPEKRYLEMEGYIDHPGDLYEMVDALLEDPNLLYGYLFNDNSMISTGNDNDDRGIDYAKDTIFSVYKGN